MRACGWPNSGHTRISSRSRRQSPNRGAISPQPINTTLLGGAVGLMLAAGIVLLIEYLDETIKSTKDITERFDLPVIGYIGEMTRSMPRVRVRFMFSRNPVRR